MIFERGAKKQMADYGLIILILSVSFFLWECFKLDRFRKTEFKWKVIITIDNIISILIGIILIFYFFEFWNLYIGGSIKENGISDKDYLFSALESIITALFYIVKVVFTSFSKDKNVRKYFFIISTIVDIIVFRILQLL